MTAHAATVAIVDNEWVHRHGLMAAVATAGDLRLLYAVDAIDELDRELALGERPDVVLLDLALDGGLQGIEAVGHLAGRGLGVLVVSTHYRVGTIKDALRAGARGIMPKSETPEEIVRAIRIVARGDHYYSSRAAATLLRGSDLTDRQRDVLELLAQGATYHEVAMRLGITERAVGGHMERIAAKTGTRKSTALLRIFFRDWRRPRDDPYPE